jgi:hypothetical protein
MHLPHITTAGAALAVSLAVALWQLLQWTLEGGRVRLRLRPATLDNLGTLHTGPEPGWPSTLPPGVSPASRWSVELAQLTIENLGRTAVTVSAGLDFGRVSWRRFGRWTIVPRVVAREGFSVERRVRLEPFDEVAFLFDLWSVLDPARGDPPPRPLTVRGTARVAGKRLSRRSPSWKRWTVRPGQLSLFPGPVDRAQVIYVSVWRDLETLTSPDGVSGDATMIASAVEKEYARGTMPGSDQLTEVIRKYLFPNDVEHLAPMISYNLQRRMAKVLGAAAANPGTTVLDLAETMAREAETDASGGEPPEEP